MEQCAVCMEQCVSKNNFADLWDCSRPLKHFVCLPCGLLACKDKPNATCPSCRASIRRVFSKWLCNLKDWNFVTPTQSVHCLKCDFHSTDIFEGRSHERAYRRQGHTMAYSCHGPNRHNSGIKDSFQAISDHIRDARCSYSYVLNVLMEAKAIPDGYAARIE
jgi:hypothetical protein